MARRLVLLCLVWSLGGCDDYNPTSPLDCTNLTVIHADQAFYRDRPETQTTLQGRLTKNCPAPTPGGRDHCYFLGQTPVYSSGKDTVLDQFVNRDVTIVGKNVTLQPFPPEIWPGTICTQR